MRAKPITREGGQVDYRVMYVEGQIAVGDTVTGPRGYKGKIVAQGSGAARRRD